MTFREALQIVQASSGTADAFDCVLACGFTPLHLSTFLSAHLQQQLPDRKAKVATGLYGDLIGTIELAGRQPAHALAVALEWADLDPRLGFRSSASWDTAKTADVPQTVSSALDRLGAALAGIPPHVRVCVSLPTVPMAPLFPFPGGQAGATALLLEERLLCFAARIAAERGVAVLSRDRLEEISPAPRYDLKSDLHLGIPYTVGHADALAGLLAQAIAPPAHKKGIITDLDDTFWRGIVGEVGPDQVTWDLAGHSQAHGLYQKLLSALSERGTLVAVASRNDPAVVAKAFERADLLCSPERLFPIEAHWQPKSGSVTRILQAWNISADSVIFVDDSPLELAEVAAAAPGIHCVRFPKDDPAATLTVLQTLRDLCARERVSEEDRLRLGSIRERARAAAEVGAVVDQDAFLRELEAQVTIDWDPDPLDARPLELINKTNQFTLNGARLTETDWQQRLATPCSVVAVVSYQDKFGPLGRIGVFQGCRRDCTLDVGIWVMSCRAFARRIEHRLLDVVFHRFGLAAIRFQFHATGRNGPIADFLESMSGRKPDGELAIARGQFETACPALFHDVIELGSVA